MAGQYGAPQIAFRDFEQGAKMNRLKKNAPDACLVGLIAFLAVGIASGSEAHKSKFQWVAAWGTSPQGLSATTLTIPRSSATWTPLKTQYRHQVND